MKISKRQLRRIIKEEKAKIISEQSRSLEDYTTTEYEGYKHGDPVAAASNILMAMEEFAEVVATSLPLAGSTLSPGIKATIIPSLMEILAQRGIRIR